ncbi:ribosome small subunit-dependent GTPase A [Brevibacterium sp. 50QC2O2]|jgi:ribosome biogenesis GTPase|uniref:ribosome small subunit-dependent GTPase A n=1 Tax=Brevibacterium TaxID=1696 RepID=UPI00211C6B96|nr:MULTISPECIES: ribosome small subunit-dependent GTPase A [unclassified Brevibacterium]MCQ9368274.1 ribosome small subunit-dependent GTPase A [Brevibacterium sp. 91QC2O2]MCQ9384776.1 ribosome small subunit-dependent GTPase A [Brevibacterium sp. 68QC2CO]MCQ9387538.1 ribosome small subunit-dependent GTPase A [Brevibacterium sp. 50QC2O2]
MSRRYTNFTEDDYRARPNRHGSRPRTKDRPRFADALAAVVVAVDRGRYRARLLTPEHGGSRTGPVGPGNLRAGAALTCVRASALRRNAIVPGDVVRVVGDTSGRPDTLARIVLVEPRATVLRRSADDSDDSERVIVANADQLVIVTATADPEPSDGLIDRALAAAFDAGITPILAVTKTDLKPADELTARFSQTGADIIECGLDAQGLPRVDELRTRLTGHLSVLLGHSGVGKSTLMNRLVPDVDRATGAVNDVTGRGRHTSSSALASPLPGGGWVIDTPGVRSFGLAHVDPDNVLAAFTELVPATAGCPRGCTHLADAPGCALDEWVAQGRAGVAGVARLASLRRLLANLAPAQWDRPRN